MRDKKEKNSIEDARGVAFDKEKKEEIKDKTC